MIKSNLKNLPVYKFNIFAKIAGIEHFVTTREYSAKTDAIGGFNLSYKVDDTIENVDLNRKILAESLDINVKELFIPVQTHSDRVGLITKTTNHTELEDIDALVTSRKNLCIAVMAADCVPILLYDYKNNIAAAVHAGWKGTVNRIVEKTVETMVQKLGGEPKNIVVGIGPSICAKIYEVGNEVADQFHMFDEKTRNKIVLSHTNTQKKYLNLQYANKSLLLGMGVKEEHIEIANICTYTNHNMFYSARFFKNNCGRFATGIIIR